MPIHPPDASGGGTKSVRRGGREATAYRAPEFSGRAGSGFCQQRIFARKARGAPGRRRRNQPRRCRQERRLREEGWRQAPGRSGGSRPHRLTGGPRRIPPRASMSPLFPNAWASWHYQRLKRKPIVASAESVLAIIACSESLIRPVIALPDRPKNHRVLKL